MGRFYGIRIKNKVINPKTGSPWVITDVPRLFRPATEKWLAENPD